MAHINIILSTDNTLSAAFVRWHQRCEWSHCEIQYDDYIIGARNSGVNIFERQTVADRHKVGTLSCTADQKKVFDKFIHEQIGHGYDWSAYWGFLLNKNNKQERKKWFCSELLLTGLNNAGIEIFNPGSVEPWNCMPRDFAMAKDIKF